MKPVLLFCTFKSTIAAVDKVHNQPEVIKKAKTMVQPVESGAGLLVCLNNVRWGSVL